MITLFIIGLAGTAVMLGAIPVLAFALMLETCSARDGKRPARVQRSDWAGVPPSIRPAHG
jgi:hypothetical protein